MKRHVVVVTLVASLFTQRTAIASDGAASLEALEESAFVEQARTHYAEGNYNASRDLCEELLKRKPASLDAREVLEKSKRQLTALAGEAYLHGALLESMNLLPAAKQYWIRALNYLRPGDKYYDWTKERLAHYP